MSWECRYRADGHCNKLNVRCDPGIRGCVLHGKVYFPFAPEKNPQPRGENAGTGPEDKPKSNK